MSRCRPSKWVPWALLGVGLPVLGAYLFSSGGLQSRVAEAAKSTLGASDITKWADVDVSGRDVTIKGESLTQSAIDDAVMAVAGTMGVRTVNTAGATLAALTAPTIESMATASTTPELRGTWQEGVATTLAVTVAGVTYKLGEAPELTTSAGNWLLKLAQPIAEGSFDATVESSDGAARMVAAPAPAKIMIDATPPVLAVPSIPSGPWPYVIAGTWAEEPGATLQAEVAGVTYALGGSPMLTSDGAGNYAFAPTDITVPGSYDVKLTSSDAVGNVTTTILPAGIMIPAVAAVAAAEAVAAPAMEAPLRLTAAAPEGATWPYAITGSFTEEPGSKLKARFAGRSYELGRGAALTSDGKGTFTFAPVAKNLGAGTYTAWFTATSAKGVKAVTSANVTVPEPMKAAEVVAPKPELAVPTVDMQLALSGAPIIKGTWPQGQADMLKVTVAGRAYELGIDANLSSKDGKWSLFPASSLKDGYYDVVADIADDAGQTRRDTTVAELEVDGDQPVTPTLAAYSGAGSPTALTGTWDEKQAKTLAVALPAANIAATLGTEGSPLTSDGGGNWSLALANPLPVGSYDVEVTTTDVHGRIQTVTAAAGIVVAEAPAPVVEVLVPPTPPVPKIGLYAAPCAADAAWPREIKGRWSEGTAVNLKAKLAGRTYVLGQGSALTSNGSGEFTFAPRAGGLKPGAHTIWFTSKGPGGDVRVAKCDITVPAPVMAAAPAPEPTPVAEPAPAPAEVFVPPTPPVPKIGLYAAPCAADAAWPREIKGRWSEGTALNLKAKLAGRTYVLGQGSALTSNGSGEFTFSPRAGGLRPGAHTIWFTSKGPGGDVRVAKCDITVPAPVMVAAAEPAPAPAPVEVFVPPTPPVPKIGLYAAPCAADATWPREIKGRWSEGTALNLKAKLAGRTYVLGQGSALTSNGSGAFTFAPRAGGLKPGAHTIWFTSKGPGGDVRVAKCDITVAAPVMVAAAEPPMVPEIVIPARPFDCVATLSRLNQIFPIRFEFDRTELQGISSLSLSQYAALLKDPRCAGLKVEINGHADFKGTVIYNQGLSEQRASVVLSALKDAGVGTSRLSPKGFSELVPFDPATTDEAREKNRRVDFTVAKN